MPILKIMDKFIYFLSGFILCFMIIILVLFIAAYRQYKKINTINLPNKNKKKEPSELKIFYQNYNQRWDI